MNQDARGASRIRRGRCERRSRCIKNIGVAIARPWWRKVWMIKNIEHFHPELDVEVFRDALDAIVFEDREVHSHDARAD